MKNTTINFKSLVRQDTGMSDFNLNEYEEISERELHELYDDCLNECHPVIKIGDLTYEPADVLKSVDPIAYRCGFNDWLDAESDTYIEHNGEYYVKNKRRGNTMSNLKAVRRYIERNKLNEHTISLCVAGPEVEYNAEYLDHDTSYGRCDITGTRGIVHWCAALNKEGEIVHFQALDSLVGGALGRIAGAF